MPYKNKEKKKAYNANYYQESKKLKEMGMDLEEAVKLLESKGFKVGNKKKDKNDNNNNKQKVKKKRSKNKPTSPKISYNGTNFDLGKAWNDLQIESQKIKVNVHVHNHLFLFLIINSFSFSSFCFNNSFVFLWCFLGY